MGRFNILKKKSSSRCETPTFVADSVAKAVEVVTEEKITERIKTAKETIDFGGSEDNSLLEKSTHSQPVADGAKGDAKDDAKKDVEDDEQTKKMSSDFRKWVDDHPILAEPTKPKTAHELLGTMWLDFVETKVMKSVCFSAACGDFDDETTAASTTTYNSEDDLAAYALASTPREEVVPPRKRASKSKSQKRKSSRRTRRTRDDKR